MKEKGKDRKMEGEWEMGGKRRGRERAGTAERKGMGSGK